MKNKAFLDNQTIDTLLKAVLALAIFLSGFMVIWILIGPASWRIGWDTLPFSQMHRTMLEQHFARQEGLGRVPRSLVFKYEGHPAIQVSHTLAGALWAGILPFQFHKGFRRQYPLWHRWMGRIFLTMSATMMVGVALMLHRRLDFHQYDFGDLASSSSSSSLDGGGVVSISIWFLITGAMAWNTARQRRFAQHQAWVIRHAAAGLWVALQRLIIYSWSLPKTREQQRDNFGNSGFVGICISLALAEITIVLIGQKEKQLKAQ
mmetsp:Transcript_30051/g.70116  ORF Transcript_30051/g.70116 Transcript_30051/m.70116 type:complete len:262 (-) Transcript_30051:1428-2213(-)